MNIFKTAFAKLSGGEGQKLRQRYYLAKEFAEGLCSAEQVYANDLNRLPINKSDYLAMLNAFEKLLGYVEEVPAAYDTDFRRNLLGGGLDGLVVPDMTQRIDQARRYLTQHEASAAAGQSILQNINACLGLIPHDADVDDILKSVRVVVMRVASGVVRPAEISKINK